MRKLYFTPNADEVELFLDKNINDNLKKDSKYKILHLTPTLILYRKRKQFYKKFFRQLVRREQHGVDWSTKFIKHVEVNEFFHWAKDAVYREKLNPISRNESHILIKRAITEVMPNRKDWLSTSYQLMDTFQYFQTLTLTLSELAEISFYDDWKVIIKIYEKYLDLLSNISLEDYSQALVRLITKSNIFDEYSEVIMDGPFLFFEPIHEALISRCKQLNIPLSFIVPFQRIDQEGVNPAYKVIQKTYSLYVPENEWKPVSSYRSYSSFLEQIPNLLFTEQCTKYDDSITIHRYDSIEEEVFDVVTRIKQKIEQGYSSVNKIAIVTPNSKQLRPLVREISENIGIDVEVPERPFLGLTSGEFLNFIYMIKNDERKFEKDSYLDGSMFKRVLNSKWFENAHKTLLSFQAIEEVFFEDIVTVQEWIDRFRYLLEIKRDLIYEEFPFHPLQSVSEEDLLCWIKVLDKLANIQHFIFSQDEGSIADHAINLFTALKNMVSNQEQDAFIQENINRIENIINGIKTQDRIKIKPQEFGSLLSSLFIEQEDVPEGTESDNFEDPDSKGILVTSLQNIAYQKYNYIYAIQFTQDNYPGAQHSTWPIHQDILWKLISKTTRLKLYSQYELEKLYADREKYYFYLSFSSAKIAYGLSYSRFEDGISLSPSHYISDIAKTIGIEDQNPLEAEINGKKMNIEEVLQNYKILRQKKYKEKYEEPSIHSSLETTDGQPLIDSTISLDDLAIYKLCPKRFQYKNLYANRNIYTTSFQVTTYLANELFIRAITRVLRTVKEARLIEEHETKKFMGVLIDLIPDSIKAEAYIFRMFPVSEEVKENAKYYASMFMENLFQVILDKGILKNLATQGKVHSMISFDVLGKQSLMEVSTDKNQYSVTATRDFAVNLGHFPQRTFSLSHRSSFLNSSIYDLEVRSGNSVISYYRWLNKIKREFFYTESENKIYSELAEILKKIEKEEYEKQKGSHCYYCPFYKVCLEKESVVDLIQLDEGEENE